MKRLSRRSKLRELGLGLRMGVLMQLVRGEIYNVRGYKERTNTWTVA